MDLEALPTAFTHSLAQRHGLSDRALAQLTSDGRLDRIARGIYAKPDHGADPDLLEIALRNSRATLCLATALARHGLTDEIPAKIDAALPRGTRRPTTSAPTRWHSFAADTFDLGRDTMTIADGIAIGIYSPARTIIDAYRLRHNEGADLAHRALRNWLAHRGNHPSTLLALSQSFPRATPALRTALETLG